MKSLRLPALFLAPALLVFAAQAAAARQEANRVQTTAGPIWTLTMDGSRVAYASGGKIRVWDSATGKTSVVKGRYGGVSRTANATASQIAIAGKRVAWIRDQQFGNTEEGENLYTASVGGTAHQVRHVYRYGVNDPTLTKGGWIDGLVGAGKHLVVSSWKSDGTTATDEQLSLVTAKGLSALAGGAGAIVAQAIEGGHIAVLSSSRWSTSTSASIYSVAGEPLARIPLGAASAVALSGNLMIVLTPAPTPSLQVYDWTTGTLEHTWPAVGATTLTSGPHQVGQVKAYGKLVLYSVYTGYVGGNERLHVLDPTNGKDAVVTRVKGYGNLNGWAVGSRGIVYAVNSGVSGKLELVPTAKLESLLG
jgi:hypothetical protein